MYESKHEKLIATRAFITRVSYNTLLGILITLLSLGLGMLGYHHFGQMSWPEAFENASMILSGMGPVGDLKTVEGKIFAGTYALFSGIVFLIVMAVIFAPVIHRFFHKFHIK